MRLGLLILSGIAILVSTGCDLLPDSASANTTLMERVNRYDKAKRSALLRGTCDDISGVLGVRYCRYQTGPNPQYTIWFFHGAGESEMVFESSPFSQDSYLDLERRLPAVDIVTISYGPIWLLTETSHRTLEPSGATIEIFKKTVVPFLNGLGLARPYIAMGHSQGGTNVATVCAALPDMWAKCVLLNPMLPSCDPFSPWPLCPPAPFLAPLGALGPNFLVRANYSESDWKKAQPLVLLKNAKTLATRELPRLFVTACSSDEFGLFAGPKAWSDRAHEYGFTSEWIPVPRGCDHFHWPADQVARFLTENPNYD
jgi:pimeloyl-ACP methyl ester carboxylesterase